MKKLLVLSTLFAIALPSQIIGKDYSSNANPFRVNKFNASSDSGSEVLRLLNLEDYIYLQEEDEELPDLVDQFEEYAKSLGYSNCEVVYDTTDTNETMYNELLTGKAQYDVVCTSDYMIQKMVNDNLLYKFTSEDKEAIPHYFGDDTSVSSVIAARLGNIVCNNGDKLEDYAVGYMWGTLGILFNPTYSKYVKNGISEDQIVNDMQSWGGLWNETYKNTLSIKDSVRDLYAAGVLYTYDDELEVAKKQYQQDGDMDKYNKIVDEIMNRCSQEQIDLVKTNLDTLKKNAFGLEVDSGKQDIVTGKIGLNIAWSGDACYSIDEASVPQESSDGFDLLYSLPENGSNVWFDGWFIPNTSRSQKQHELALLWLDFISDPEYAVQNMYYTGYTSFVGGEEIASYVYDSYDVRSEMSDEELEAFDPSEYEAVDLTYFFGDNLSSESEFVNEEGKVIFYSDCYLPFYYENENGELVHNISVGGGFFCQYPSEEAIARCGVMKDFGSANANIVKMWEDFKSDALPTWAIVLFVVELVLIVGGISIFFINKRASHALRKKRLKNK